MASASFYRGIAGAAESGQKAYESSIDRKYNERMEKMRMDFQAEQGDLNRGASATQNQAGIDAAAKQSELDRTFKAGETDDAQEFTAGENEAGRVGALENITATGKQQRKTSDHVENQPSNLTDTRRKNALAISTIQTGLMNAKTARINALKEGQSVGSINPTKVVEIEFSDLIPGGGISKGTKRVQTTYIGGKEDEGGSAFRPSEQRPDMLVPLDVDDETHKIEFPQPGDPKYQEAIDRYYNSIARAGDVIELMDIQSDVFERLNAIPQTVIAASLKRERQLKKPR